MAGEIRSHRDLIAWQKAFDLGLALYRATSSFPTHEQFGLTSQLRRGGVSVASNIAEGYGRGSRSDYARFLKLARGALYEVDTQVLFAERLKYLDSHAHADLQGRIEECGRVLAGLLRSVEDYS